MNKLMCILLLLMTVNELCAKDEIVKKGLSFGPLPIVAYDQDRGFQYGALMEMYDFGNGSYYPNPRQKWYFELSAFTKGTKQVIIEYDSKQLFEKVRFQLSGRYTDEKAYDFYGFNGLESYYDSSEKAPFYRLDKRLPSIKADAIIPITDNLHLLAGYHFDKFMIGNADLDNLNKGKAEEDKFYGRTLFERYRQWGLISASDADGGVVSALQVGLKYDTRDNEALPTRGIWAETYALLAPEMLGTEKSYYRYNMTWRQYFPVAGERLVFAYRLIYNGVFGNYAPFYVLPSATQTLRGVMRNRVLGLDMAYANVELRWLTPNFHLFRQNVSLGLSLSGDAGRLIRPYETTFTGTEELREEYDTYKTLGSDDKLHTTVGAGFQFVMNRNFVVAFTYGKPLVKQDGNGGLYVKIGYLF